ncbi:MAG: N-6 DNA methylase [Candidatus Bathyarchaeota archaeon]|nr:MAG: N-6 DNA methylase [Candidatus Bathyarchaeota archaeon]
MKPLDKTLRNQLENTVKEARDIAENAAKIALEQLGVERPKPFAHLSEAERELRRKLRVHGRQLGDLLNGDKAQKMDRLIEEVAYEHWHRMLFARFLSENNLLMYPDPANPVPVTLEECEDLAPKEGAKNGWELAARYAAHMLPQIFRQNSPVFQLTLSPEHQQKLEQLINELPHEVFTATDSLGWVYQFWQAKKKDEVNASEVKIGARELPVVTQLFTEPYMVSFLLDNSIGAWWAAQRLTKNDLVTAKNENELRQKASISDVPLKYLRFIKNESESWTLAAGNFNNWPQDLSNLKIIDPCCGSGHFLVATLLMLVPMRMDVEGISPRDAVDAVLRDNIQGLEIDQRCVELAAFALALAAWRYPGSGGYRQLSEINVACSGLAINVKRDEWLALADDSPELRYVLEELYRQFSNAPLLGSLINPKLGLGEGSLIGMKWQEVAPLMIRTISSEMDIEKKEMQIVAQGVAKAATLLANKYHLVVTNVPYLTQGKQNDALREFCKKYYPTAKNDLATVFLDRCLDLCTKGGTCNIVLPQNWLFLARFNKFRRKLLKNDVWNLIARLGSGAFETITGEVVKAILLSITRITNNSRTDSQLEPYVKNNLLKGIDVSKFGTVPEKATNLATGKISQVGQATQLNNPDAVILFEERSHKRLLRDFAISLTGAHTLDIHQFRFFFWEIDKLRNKWNFHMSTPEKNKNYSGLSFVSYTREKGEKFAKLAAEMKKEGFLGGWLSGNKAWGKKGVACSWMHRLPASIYNGAVYDNMVAVILPEDEKNLSAIWCFCSSPEFNKEVRKINQKMQVANSTLAKVPFDLDYWNKIAQVKYPCGLPKPYSSDPTQWIFHGHLAQSTNPLQVAIIRIMGYCWPAEVDNTLDLSEEGCLLREKAKNLSSFTDHDGIICIPSVRGELKAEDRLEDILAAAYGIEWCSAKRSELLAKADYAEKTLESWLRNKFFIQHCKLFHDRPLIWQIWDGLSDGFSALINYHKLDAKLLETLIYTYLGDWINHQKQDKVRGIDGAEEKLTAAEILKKRLELILEGEEPYDIFVRWKPIEQQPIGWNPDLNDGVRVNIRPFMSVPDIGKKGAGILRDKPNIKWNKDRGKDVQSAPWFKLGPKYGGREGDRINDHHLSLAEKKAARKKSK